MRLCLHTKRLFACLCIVTCTNQVLLAQGWKNLFWEDIQEPVAFWSTNPDMASQMRQAKMVQDSTGASKATDLIMWNAYGKPVRITYPGGYLREFVYQYNSHGMIIEYEEHYSTGSMYKCSYMYNTRNEAVSVKCVTGEGRPALDADVVYNSHGKLRDIEVSYYDSTIVDAMLLRAEGMRMPIKVRYRYRYKGDRMYEVNLDTGRRYTYAFDQFNRLIEIHYGDDRVFEYTYDSCGGLATARAFQQHSGVLIEEYRVHRTKTCALAGFEVRQGDLQEFISSIVIY